jgi:hypothetical protein
VTIEQVGSLGEIIGAVATVATLVYLAGQIRQNTSVVRTSNYMQLNSHFAEFTLRVAENGELYDVWNRGQESYGELSAAERARYHSLLSSMFTHFETSQRLWDRRQIDAGLYEEMIENAHKMLATPGPKQWWLESKSWYSPEFQASLDERVGTTAAQQGAAADSA